MDITDSLVSFLFALINHPQCDSSFIGRILKPANKNVEADYAINCFALKSIFNMNGDQIALELEKRTTQEMMQNYAFIESIFIQSAYFNIKLNKAVIAYDTLSQILRSIDTYAKSAMKSTESKKVLVIEYPSPNTNKPLHLGHIRNMLLGQALAKLNQELGHSVYQVNLFNDRGIHICKSMWAYKHKGNQQTPEIVQRKSDHFVGDFYVIFAKEEAQREKLIHTELLKLEQEQQKELGEQNRKLIADLEAQIDASPYGQLQNELKEMLYAWEHKDPEVFALWSQMNQWAIAGFNQTFQKFKIVHDKTYFESQIYDKGKDIILKGLNQKIFEKLEDGAIIARFSRKDLPPQKVLIRSDGTALYITQDLYLAFEKMKDFHYDQSIFVIGNEQDMQLRVVFELLRNLGMTAENIHYSYGMINLTTGKMKSREGTVVDADDLLDELKLLAQDEIKKRYPDLLSDQIQIRAYHIAMAALRYYILKYEYTRDFIFDPQSSIAFEGDTGPYILYSYARICSIYQKGMETQIPVPYDPHTDSRHSKLTLTKTLCKNLTTTHELTLINLLAQFPKVVYDSATLLKPHLLIRYLNELAQEFTGYYHESPILKEEAKIRKTRLLLVEAIRLVLKKGLEIFTIDVLTEM